LLPGVDLHSTSSNVVFSFMLIFLILDLLVNYLNSVFIRFIMKLTFLDTYEYPHLFAYFLIDRDHYLQMVSLQFIHSKVHQVFFYVLQIDNRNLGTIVLMLQFCFFPLIYGFAFSSYLFREVILHPLLTFFNDLIYAFWFLICPFITFFIYLSSIFSQLIFMWWKHFVF